MAALGFLNITDIVVSVGAQAVLTIIRAVDRARQGSRLKEEEFRFRASWACLLTATAFRRAAFEGVSTARARGRLRAWWSRSTSPARCRQDFTTQFIPAPVTRESREWRVVRKACAPSEEELITAAAVSRTRSVMLRVEGPNTA